MSVDYFMRPNKKSKKKSCWYNRNQLKITVGFFRLDKLKRAIFYYSKFVFIFCLIFSSFFSIWSLDHYDVSLFQKIQKAEAATTKHFSEKKINFNFTDDNTNENLIIKTDKKTYVGLARSEVYFSVTNISDKSESVNLQVYFPNDNGEVSQIQKWTTNIPYQVDVSEYDSESYFCEEGWIKEVVTEGSECIVFNEDGTCAKHKNSSSQNSESSVYQCFSSRGIKACDSLSEDSQNCFVDKVQTGLYKETRYKDDWQDIRLSNNALSIDEEFESSLAVNKVSRKPIPDNLRIKKSTSGGGNIIEPNQTQYFKMSIEFLPNTSGEFYIEAIGDKSGYGILDPWWDGDWVYYKEITIDNTKIDSTLAYFPVLISLSSDDSLASYAQNDGDDIAFIASDESTQLDHEIEYFNGTTGQLQAWVEVPSISSSSDTTIYMYYGNPSAGNQENVTGTWDSNHKLVHHLKDATTSTNEDSTSNNNDGTKRTANEPIETSSGKIAQAQSFDGSNDYVKITNNVAPSPSSLTISAWIQKESGGHTYECALHKGSANTIGSSDYWLGVDINDQLTATIGANTGVGWQAGQTTSVATYGTWYHLAAVWDGSVVRVYINGTYNKQYNLSTYGNLTTETRFGSSADGTNYQFRGVVDEVRISDTNRSAAWIKAEYENQNSPSTFYALGDETGLSAPTLHNVPFDGLETPDTTPSFEFTAEDEFGTADLVYQIQWDDNIDFSSPTTRTSDTDSGFENTEDGADTSPFTENQRIRFTVQAGDALANSADNEVYYWRVRAKTDGGVYRAWSSEDSRFRINTSLSDDRWTQTIDEQFDDGTLVDVRIVGSDGVELDVGLDVKSAKGSFTTPASTGYDSITGVGFQPKAVIFWAVPRTDESAGSDASHFIGFSDGSTDRASGIKSEDGVNDTGRGQEDYAIFLRNVDTSNLAIATVSSFDSDGFTLNYTTTNSGYYIHYIAFGGDDLSAEVGEKLVSASFIDSLSFAPDIMFLTTVGLTDLSTDDQHGIYSFGVVDDTSHWHLSTHQGSNDTTKDGRLRDEGCLSQSYSNSVTWEMTNCSLTSNGMSWSGSNVDEFYYLALNIGGQSTKVGTFFKETSGTAGAIQDLSSWGFGEDAAIVGFASAGKTDELFSDHVRSTIGAYDGSTQGMIAVNDINGTSDSDSIQNNDYAIGIVESNASILAGGTASQLDNDGVRLTWNPNNTTAYNIGYWAIEGGNEVGDSGSITSPSIDYDLVSGASSWDDLSWTDDETNGDIKYQLQYWDGDSWELIPDGSLSGNSSGFDTSPVDLSGLNTTTYNQLKIKATLTNSGGTPILQDWSIGWKSETYYDSIQIRAKDYTTSISSITFPEATPGKIVSNPYNDIDTVSSPQTFGGAGTAEPVVTLFNGGAGSLIVWYNISSYTEGAVSNEYYAINDKGAACADANCVSNSMTFDSNVSTGTTMAAGAGNEKDLYLKVVLNSSWGKSGTSTLTILGETP